jgi:cytoskeleton protein RodZ
MSDQFLHTDTQPSAGHLLRRAREAAGLHVAALAVSIKVPVRKLEALEADRYDELPDAVFTRALAASICRTLKIDAQPIMARLPQTTQPRLQEYDSSKSMPFRAPVSSGHSAQYAFMTHISKPAVILGLAFLLGALALLLTPDIPALASIKNRLLAVVESAQPAINSVAKDTANASSAVTEPVQPGASTAQVTSNVTPNLSISASLSTPTVASPTLVISTSTTASPAADVTGSLVAFKAGQNQSWVQVTDARGKVMLQRNLQPGEAVGAGGNVPLKVIVGSADTTEVLVRGQSFDAKSLARSNVARFEVK